MSLRFSTRTTLAAATVATTALAALTGLVGAASAAAPLSVPANRIGLYGSQDPTFDGTYRQSLALLALHAAGQTPAAAAVTWLLTQQCADGGFESFRTDVSKACTAPDSTTFSGEDSNSTGIAVQALVALGKTAEATAAVGWLGTHQNTDGGWAYYPDGVVGNDSDANSTSLGLSAYSAAGLAAPTKNGATPQDLLGSLQVDCSGVVDERGAFTFFVSANDFATVQATLAMASGFLPVPALAGADDAPVLPCPPKAAKAVAPRAKVAAAPLAPALSADYAAGYLARRLAANSDVIPDPFNPGSADVGSTANAVIALVATKHSSSQVAATITALGGQAAAFIHVSGADVPGALATLALADLSAGDDPADFGGTNLVARLAATLTAAAPSATPSPSATHSSQSVQPADPGASVSAAHLAATGGGNGASESATLAGLLLVTGGGLVLGVRRSPRPRHGHGS